jgi:hypothetical protein
MINLGRAVGIIINSLFVTSEAISAGMKGDWSRTVHKSLLKTISWAVCWDGASDLDDHLASIILALGVIGNIGITLICHQAELLDVSIPIGIETTIAAVVSVSPWAIYELLLSKDDTAVVFNCVVLLNGAGCREWPAAAALSLVLNGADDTHITPVYRRDLWLLKRANLLSFLSLDFSFTVVASEVFLELFFAQIRETIHSDLICGSVSRIMFSNKFKLCSEILLASLVLLLGSVTLSLLGKVPDEDLVNRIDFLKEITSGLNGGTRVEEAEDGNSCCSG